MSKIKVTGLKLETANGKKVKLSLEEAKELHEQLNDLFGKDVQYVRGYPYQYWYNTYPVWGGGTVTTRYENAANTALTSSASNVVQSNTTGMKVSYLSQ